MIIDMTKESEDNQGIRLTALAIVICFSVFLSIIFVTGKFSKPQRLSVNSLEDRINPNAAPAASLVRLPGIGRAKADAIISYRKKAFSSGEDKKAFKDAADLDKISGIGPKTVENIREFLKFE